MITLPRTTPEQRAPLYDDVETLVTTGFLSHSATVGGTKVSLRTLCPGDMALVRSRAARGGDADWQAWMISTSVWMIDGMILLDDPNAAWHVHKRISRLHRAARSVLFSILVGLFVRQGRAHDAVEPWCFESQSRFKWKASKGLPHGALAGIPGAERLGLNAAQLMWRAFNEMEDLRFEEEALWEGFKLTASASAPKGVRKIDQHDRARRQAEDDRRQTALDKFYYVTKGVVAADGSNVVGKNGETPFVSAGSKDPDQLADEMYRWVTGQEDAHDRIVSEYKRKVVERFEAERAERESRRRAFQQKQRELEESAMPTKLVALTADQLQELLRGRPAGVRTVIEDDWEGKKAQLYDKHLANVPDAGILAATEDGRLVDPTWTTAVTLQEMVAARKVAYRVDRGE